MARYRFSFDLVTDDQVSMHDIPPQSEVMEAVKSEMAALLSPQQKRHIRVEAAATYNGHHHESESRGYCAYCDENSRDRQAKKQLK